MEMAERPLESKSFRRIAAGVIGLAFALGALGCDDTEACKPKSDCKLHGKCSVNEKGSCVVAADADCAASDECRLHGKCSAKDGACVATSDQACQASDDCKKQAACDASEGVCLNLAQTVSVACTKSCQTEGRCVMKAGQCVALSRRHCA